MRIDAFLAEKYHYSPTQIAQLTPTECCWLCVNWSNPDSEDLTINQYDDQFICDYKASQQQRIVELATTYRTMSPEEILNLAKGGIYSEYDYVKANT